MHRLLLLVSLVLLIPTAASAASTAAPGLALESAPLDLEPDLGAALARSSTEAPASPTEALASPAEALPSSTEALATRSTPSRPGARSLDASRRPFTESNRWAGYRLASDEGATSDRERSDLMVKLSMAQFHHLRAMHGITWSLITIVTTPGIAVLGGALLIGGALSGLFTGDTGVLIVGIIIVAAAATGFAIAVPTLIGNLIQATASAARVEDLRRRLLSDDVAGLSPPVEPRHPGLRFTVAF